jgi:(p)ppGpp synthase/HD superfamily hydrolase
MSKAKLLPPEWSSIAEWCEEVGVNQSLFYAILELFKDKIDKGGKPYIGHLIRVTQNVKPQFARIAFCHDVIEDCGVDEKWLMNPDFGLTEYEIKAIRTLTRPKGMTYSNYILSIMNIEDLGIMYVKMADLLDNMNLNRLRDMSKEDIDRVTDRYIPAYEHLSTKIWQIIRTAKINKDAEDIYIGLLSDEYFYEKKGKEYEF